MNRDAVGRTGSRLGTGERPRIGGYRVTDVSALAGSVLWIGISLLALTGRVPLTVVELFVSLALLTLVPLGLGVIPQPASGHGDARLYSLAVAGQFPCALAAVGGLTFPVRSLASTILVVPWIGVTGVIALFGLSRLYARGIGPVPELAIDAALLYVPVGAVALLLHRAGVSFHFQPIIILLTVVHYHYAGFVLPLVAGLAGRLVGDEDGRFGNDYSGRVATVTTLVIVVNLAVIAVGITFSPTVEVLAVGLFTVAVAGFAVFVLGRVAWTAPRVPGVLLAVASLSIVATMALALAYGYSAFPLTPELVSIGEMVRWHGSLNAFGFALPALVAFRLLGENDAAGRGLR